MNPLIGTDFNASFDTLIALALCSGAQVANGYLRAFISNRRLRAVTVIYESAILAHIIIVSFFLFECLQGQTTPALHVFGIFLPFSTIMWANVGVSAIALYAFFRKVNENDLPELKNTNGWMPLAEAVLTCLFLPPIMEAMGDRWVWLLYLDAIYIAYRTTYMLHLDLRIRSIVVTRLSMAEALKSLPEGILYADSEGSTIVANDAMRHSLSSLGLPTDFAQASELWAALQEKAANENSVEAVQSLQREKEPWLFLRISPDEVRLFSIEGSGFENDIRYPTSRALDDNPTYLYTAKRLLGSQPDIRIIAYDVTQEIEVLEEIDRTNMKLAEQQSELQSSLDNVQEAAENEASLRMRGRIHDVIGQRLSMLHRALEDDAISKEQLDKLKPLLTGILDDLAAEATIHPADELGATVAAFELSGVTVDIEGALPSDSAAAKLFADCIREATTNAVKHARSTSIRVTMSESELAIANDGPVPNIAIEEGTGLSNMRRAAASVGYALLVDSATPPFTLRLKRVD